MSGPIAEHNARDARCDGWRLLDENQGASAGGKVAYTGVGVEVWQVGTSLSVALLQMMVIRDRSTSMLSPGLGACRGINSPCLERDGMQPKPASWNDRR